MKKQATKPSAKKAPVKKSATKKAVVKKTTTKASTKKAPAKKAVTAKKPTTAKKVVTPKKTTSPKKAVAAKTSVGNGELTKMLKVIEKAKKSGQSSVVVFTTDKIHHTDSNSQGFGVQDLKPKFQEAYKHLLCNFNVKTNLVDYASKKVEWIVDL